MKKIRRQKVKFYLAIHISSYTYSRESCHDAAAPKLLKTSTVTPECYYPVPVTTDLEGIWQDVTGIRLTRVYVVGSKSFRPDIQKPRQMKNAVRDI